MDYKFYNIIKKKQTVFFIKNSYPNFEYVNPNENFTLLENSDIILKLTQSNKLFSTSAYDTFSITSCVFNENITEESIVNNKSSIDINLVIPTSYILRSFSTTKMAKVYYDIGDKISTINYTFETDFDITKLSNTDTINIEYRHKTLIKLNSYSRSVDINKNFINSISNNEIKNYKNNPIKPLLNNPHLLSAGFINTFGGLDFFGMLPKNEKVKNTDFTIKKDINLNNTFFVIAKSKPLFLNTHDVIENGVLHGISSIYNKHININNIFLVSSNSINL